MFNYKKNRVWLENTTIVMQLGLTMAGCVVFCFWIGWLIDRWVGTRGIFVIIFIIFGTIGGGVVVYRQINKVMEPKEKDQSDE